MEEKALLKPVFCNIHTSEPIARVNMCWDATKQLYCTECILSAPGKKNIQLKGFNEYIDLAAKFYSDSKPKNISVSEGNQVFSDLFSSQVEALAALSEHLEKEKSKVEDLFQTITKDVMKMLSDMKQEYLNFFDEQLPNLRYSYTFFDKQFKKANPSCGDASLLFPSKEELLQKLRQATNASDLANFVRSINDDIHEYQAKSSASRRIESQKYLDLLAQEIRRAGTIRPKLKDPGMATVIVKGKIHEYLNSLLSDIFVLENPIPSINQTDLYLDSQIVNPEQFSLVHSWLEEEYRTVQGLLFRATRDGMIGSKFRKLCDRKGPTLTLIKCQYEGSEKESILGGFLEKDWNYNGYIASEEAFMFSLTTGIKCPVKLSKYSAAGYPDCGPIFGGGHDLEINGDGSFTGTFCPHSYHDAIGLVEGVSYTGKGKLKMKIFEVEVYSVGSK